MSVLVLPMRRLTRLWYGRTGRAAAAYPVRWAVRILARQPGLEPVRPAGCPYHRRPATAGSARRSRPRATGRRCLGCTGESPGRLPGLAGIARKLVRPRRQSTGGSDVQPGPAGAGARSSDDTTFLPPADLAGQVTGVRRGLVPGYAEGSRRLPGLPLRWFNQSRLLWFGLLWPALPSGAVWPTCREAWGRAWWEVFLVPAAGGCFGRWRVI